MLEDAPLKILKDSSIITEESRRNWSSVRVDFRMLYSVRRLGSLWSSGSKKCPKIICSVYVCVCYSLIIYTFFFFFLLKLTLWNPFSLIGWILKREFPYGRISSIHLYASQASKRETFNFHGKTFTSPSSVSFQCQYILTHTHTYIYREREKG